MSKDSIKALAVAAVVILAFIAAGRAFAPAPAPQSAVPPPAAAPANSEHAVATFAGGCFWCMEPPFDHVDGVISTTSGYTGGSLAEPSYEQVSAGGTGHAEAVRVVYDPKRVSYQTLLGVFWINVDPTEKDGQFCDHGEQYRSAIFYHTAEQKRLAEGSRDGLIKHKPFAAEVHTQIVAAGSFWPAEQYHQDYYLKNPLRYKLYRTGCGRDARLKEIWGDIPR